MCFMLWPQTLYQFCNRNNNFNQFGVDSYVTSRICQAACCKQILPPLKFCIQVTELKVKEYFNPKPYLHQSFLSSITQAQYPDTRAILTSIPDVIFYYTFYYTALMHFQVMNEVECARLHRNQMWYVKKQASLWHKNYILQVTSSFKHIS